MLASAVASLCPDVLSRSFCAFWAVKIVKASCSRREETGISGGLAVGHVL